MKGVKLSVAILALFSILSIIYFNSFSIAQSDEKVEVKVESEVYKQVENNDKVRVIVNLRRNFDTEDQSKIIKYSKNNIDALSKEFSEKQGEELKIIYTYDSLNSLAIEADKKTIEALKESNLVEEIFAESTLEIQLQESLQLINATNAWNVQVPYGSQTTNLTGLGQVVCLLDTGVDYNHNALGAGWGVKIIGGWDFVNNDSNPMDDNGHGTHLAGIIAAKGVNPSNNQSIRGVAPDALIIAEKVCNSAGSCSNINMIAGLNHCLTTIGYKKLSAISMSIGDGQSYNSTSNTCPTWMDTGINTAAGYGIPVIVSSGNQGYKNGISYPACSPNATSVGATYDKTVTPFTFNWIGVCQELRVVDKIACASNTGDNLKLVAPGATITSTAASNGTVCGAGVGAIGTCSGTSQAAAHVAGAVALVRQKYNNNFKRNLIGTLKINRFLMKSHIWTTDNGNGLAFPRLSLLNLL